MVAGLLLPLVPDGILVSPASADISTVDPFQLCSTTLGHCPAYPTPAPLISEAALANLPAAEADDVRAMEAQAVQAVIASHGLSPTDGNAVQSWGREDAQAELWLLVVGAIQTAPDQRTDVQQGVVDWMSGMYSAQENLGAEQAGAEYAKWAGLDVSHYWSMASTATESELSSFLSSAVNGYNTTDTAHATGGYCKYKPPTPDSSEYDGSQTSTCFAPCPGPLECVPPTPTYDQFVKWGEDETSYNTLNQVGFNAQAVKIAGAEAIAAAALGGGVAAFLASALVPATAMTALAQALSPWMGLEWFQIAGSATPSEFVSAGVTAAAEAGFESAAEAVDAIAAVGAVVAIVIFAIITAVVEGINVGTAAAVPAKLATLVVDERTQTNDLPSMLTDTTKLTVLYELFVGATMPLPRGDSTCTRDYILSGQATGIDVSFAEYYALTLQPDQLVPNALVSAVPCLNPPSIPPASPTDPQFLVTPRGGSPGVSSTISLHDASAGYDSTVRLSGNWFVQRPTLGGAVSNLQTLRLGYTDWSGSEQQAMLVHDDDGTYRFLGASIPPEGSSIDPDTCLADGTCWLADHIDYLGADGSKYSASVEAASTPTGGPIVTRAPVEGSFGTFYANDFKPAGAVGTVDYTWQFEPSPCGPAVLCVDSSRAQFSHILVGPLVSFSWQRPGKAWVRVTATDEQGHQAVDAFQVQVGNVAPTTVQLTPDQLTADVDQTVSVAGNVHDAGTDDFENVKVMWGDGTSNTQAAGNGIVNFPDPSLSFHQVESDTSSFAMAATHAYAAPGVYFGHVTVSDFEGGTSDQTFTAKVAGPQQISFSALGDQTYGDHVALSATGSRSGQPVTFTASPAAVCTTSGDNGATLNLVGVGGCTVIAHQAAAPPLFQVAPAVPHSFSVNPAPLQIKPDDAETTYGAPDPAFTATFTGLVNGDTKDVVTGLTLHGPPTGRDAGTYLITASGATSPDYAITYQAGRLTVDKADLTVTADDKTRLYGQADPTFSVSFQGLVNGDTPATFAGITFTTNEGASDHAGTYSITPIDPHPALPNRDYRVTYVPGTLTVKPAPLTITGDDQTKVYGGTDPAFTASFSGLVNGDTKADISGLTVTGAPTGSNAGTYPVVPSGATSPNYAITYANGTERVQQAPLTITADDKTKTYGGTDPTFTASYSGLVNGDTKANISGVTVTGPPTGSNAGTYPIAVSGAVNPNYLISYTAGHEIIKPAPLLITADDKTKVYGALDPAFTASFSGLVNGDKVSAITGLAITAPPTTSHVGSYALHPHGASNGNYDISYADGTEKVTPASLTIVADPKTTASGKTPTYTWFGVGWVNGDTDATLARTGNHQPACSAITTATPGRYPGAITCQGATDADYAIGYQAATLTVDPVLSLSQTGLPTTSTRKVTVDGVSLPLPVSQLEVGYNTQHSYGFPPAVVDPNGTVYTTTAPAFSGKVTANITVSARYVSVSSQLSAAIASGAVSGSAATALTSNWNQVQADLKAGRVSTALSDLKSFASVVRAQSKKIAPAAATLLLNQAQIVFTSLGGKGTI